MTMKKIGNLLLNTLYNNENENYIIYVSSLFVKQTELYCLVLSHIEKMGVCVPIYKWGRFLTLQSNIMG